LDISEDDVRSIQNLLTQRYTYQKVLEYDEADRIRTELYDSFKVVVDDRIKEWRIETDEYYPLDTGNLSEDEAKHITRRLKERYQYKKD